ncbi:unnamed protein product [Somion occarium]|uniref:RNA-dependent RNA polymerase n=1 Tax=Somion occarium TaxID=3059160 RepID=A0ABP1DCK3_9APHY
MELNITAIDRAASQWDVKRAIGSFLHNDDFFNPTDPNARLINFKVTLHEGPGGIHHNGSGTLILPSARIGDKFMRELYRYKKSIEVNGRRLGFQKTGNTVNYQLSQTLDKAPYLPPELEEKREDILRKLSTSLHVDKVQFGVFYRRREDGPDSSRRFSNEYELSHRHKGAGLLWFEYEHKLIRVQLGDPMLEEEAYNIALSFANIKKIALGHDSFGIPFLCFDLFVPPILQREHFNRSLTGDEWEDNQKFRQRIDSVNPSHAVVAPYAHQVRLVLHHENDIRDFSKLCFVAELQRPFRAQVEADAMGFFAHKQLYCVRVWLQQCKWPIAFQLEALLRNGLLNTDELLHELRGPIQALIDKDSDLAADHLRTLTEAIRTKDSSQTAMDCLTAICQKTSAPLRPRLSAGNFLCHHVTVTPTRILLEGPYPIQSNRVIRRYAEYHDNFIRIDFRDEDRLQYRWEPDVDEIGGRLFQFLAYSSSALRQHAVWFMHPFVDNGGNLIDAAIIRSRLGDFSGVIKSPSKYAARMAQAFTATDPSVKVPRQCVEEMEDLGSDPYLHTDGVGTISKELGDQIWDALCKDRDEHYRKTAVQPSAYQIRFLGYKGVVGIDERLEGIKIRLRPSMNKFKIPGDDEAEIEIAQAFERPGMTYLNRPLITILEDRGVEKSAFLKLQMDAVADIRAAGDTMELARHLFRSHSLGTSYRIPYIIQCLSELGLGMKDERPTHILQDAFFDRLILFAKNHVLRDIKHAARIPVPDSYMLVGIADEGPVYEKEGIENVFMLEEGQIFACIHKANEEPIYLQGHVVISRSPTVHPGDVQRVWAIGKPPAGQPCFFRNLKNVVVLPSVGARSLASFLGGGDLDGDLYSLIKEPSLLPTQHVPPADYESAGTRKLPHDGDSTIEDVCDFVVEYINSDVLGLLSDRHIIIADQSKYGTNDQKCLKLAQLCSQAVDYPKNGIPVNIKDSPSRLIPYKPDWKQAEENVTRETDYYESTRALGELYRSVVIKKPEPIREAPNTKLPEALSDEISQALIAIIRKHLSNHVNREGDIREISPMFHSYAQELRYMRLTHSLSDSPDSRLEEEEVVVGTILANCSQHRYRSDRTYRMRLHSVTVVRDIQRKLYQPSDIPDIGELRYGLQQAWLAWDFGMRHRQLPGGNSFALIALGVICNILEGLGEIVLKKGSASAPGAVDEVRD